VHVAGFVAKVDDSTQFADEVRQIWRERLLLGESPRTLEYKGAGPLGAWLRVAASPAPGNARVQPVHPLARRGRAGAAGRHKHLDRVVYILVLSERQAVELFHLHLGALAAAGPRTWKLTSATARVTTGVARG
jgi:hypothetical protein